MPSGRWKGASFTSKSAETGMLQHWVVKKHVRSLRNFVTPFLSSASPSAYYSAKDDLTKFIHEAPGDRKHLLTWLKWWDDRRAFIFSTFALWDGAPKMNQAEVVHASWKHRNRENLTLLDAAERHVRECVLLETEYEGMNQWTSPAGTGPSLVQRQARKTAIQHKRPATLGKKLLREDITAVNQPQSYELERKFDQASSFRADKACEKNPSGLTRFHPTRSSHFSSRF